MTEEISDPDDIDSHYNITKNVDSVITVIAFIHVLAGVLTFPLVYFIFTSTMIQAPVFYIFLVMVDGVVLAITIPVYIVVGIAIWRIQSWAWKISVITNVIFLVINIFGSVILTAILNIILLLALNNEDVKLALRPISQ
ncbi:MAG: hypothetical protein RTU63_03340 [Candidatus Thorarchaeota archaeon]